MSKKPDEERAIAVLVEHLKQKSPRSLIMQEEEPNDPPDYWLMFDDSRFAVEITSIHDEPAGLPSKTPTPIGYNASWARFEKDLLVAGRDRDLAGAYFIFRGATPDLTTHGQELLHRILDYVDRTQHRAEPDTESVFEDDQDFIDISKINDSVEFDVGTGSAMFESGKRFGEHLARLDATMQTKRLKMQDRLTDECRGVILVIWDEIRRLTPQEWTAAIAQLKAVQWYHSVFMILPFLERDKCWFAWTTHTAWRD